MDLTAFQLGQTFQSAPAVLIGQAQDGQGNKNLVRVQSGIVPVKICDFGFLDRLYHVLGNQFNLVGDSGQFLCRIQYQSGAGSEERTRFGRNDTPVLKFYGR